MRQIVKKVRTATVLLLLVCCTQVAAAEKRNIAPSKGLDGVYVNILPLHDQATADGLSKDEVRALVTEKLNAAGIPIRKIARAANGHANLTIVIDTIKTQGIHLFTVKVALVQKVSLARAPDAPPLASETWGSGILGLTTPSQMDVIYKPLAEKLDDFVEDYQKANPKPHNQSESLEQCLSRAGGDDQEQFLAFDRELRAALSTPDPTLLTMLAMYPLRVNDVGTTSIDDAPSLYARSETVFPAAVRAAVLDTKIEDLICTNSGIGYGNGDLWVGMREQGGVWRYGIQVINLSSGSPRGDTSVKFVCRADDQRLVIDTDANGMIRLRSWYRPRALTERPDLELSSGVEAISGTGSCAHRIWSFKTGNGVYSAAERGCSSDSNPPPAGARGTFDIEADGSETRGSWCY